MNDSEITPGQGAIPGVRRMSINLLLTSISTARNYHTSLVVLGKHWEKLGTLGPTYLRAELSAAEEDKMESR